MYSFNAEQTRLVNRSQTLQHFLGDNEDIYTSVAPFARQADLLMSNNKTLAELASAKGKNGKGSTKDKNAFSSPQCLRPLHCGFIPSSSQI